MNSRDFLRFGERTKSPNNGLPATHGYTKSALLLTILGLIMVFVLVRLWGNVEVGMVIRTKKFEYRLFGFGGLVLSLNHVNLYILPLTCLL